MKDYYYNTILKQMHNYDYDVEEFFMLKNMDFRDLEKKDGYVYKVTPLLNQISKYALINAAFSPDELDMFGQWYTNKSVYKEAQKVYTSAFDMMVDGIQEKCKHPVFLTFESLLNGSITYDELMNDITELDILDEEKMVEYLSEDEYTQSLISEINICEDTKSRIYNYSKTIDDYVIGETDKTLGKVFNSLSNVKGTHALLSLLNDQAKIRLNHRLLIGSYISNNEDDISIKCSTKSITNNYNVLLSSLMKEIEENYSAEELEILRTRYLLYKSYQYQYIKNNDAQLNMLEKCKKM